jgi:23S rRNA pseudouridine2605 synthase
MEIRLQKAMADAGVASRRTAESMIREGRVTVNGRVIREMGLKVSLERDHVKVDGQHLKPPAPKAYLMMNKPKDVLTTLEAPEEDDRLTVRGLLRGVRQRVFPVGRLDYDTEGLLLLTNDGELAQRLLHPSYHVAKTYLVKLKGTLGSEEIHRLEEGIPLEDGLTAPAKVKKVRKTEENSWIELVIYEGRTHQVKRMLEAVGHPVLKLKRLQFGPLNLGQLPIGDFRFLTDPEIHRLKTITSDSARGASSMKRGSRQHPAAAASRLSRKRKSAP